MASEGSSSSNLTLKVVGLGHNLILNVSSNATVGDIKMEVERLTSLPVQYQRLLARGKKLDDDAANLDGAGIQDRTRLMLLHNEAYSKDREGVTALTALVNEIVELERKASEATMDRKAVHEHVTRICCKLDGVETHGSDSLRAIRKRAIARVEAIEKQAEHEA